MCKKCVFHTRIFYKKKSPYCAWVPHHPPPRTLRSLALPPPPPPLTNAGCTTVTGMAKGHKCPCPLLPVDWSLKKIYKEGEIGDWFMPFHITYPCFHTRSLKKSPYRGVGGGKPPSNRSNGDVWPPPPHFPNSYTVSWELEGRYHYSKMFSWRAPSP